MVLRRVRPCYFTYCLFLTFPRKRRFGITMNITMLTKAFLRYYTEHPPDTQCEWDFAPPAIVNLVRLIDNSSGSILTPGWSYLHLCLGSSISLRLTSACPATSLPSACSLIAFIFGFAFNLFLTRKFVVVRWDGGRKTMSWFFPQKYLISL